MSARRRGWRRWLAAAPLRRFAAGLAVCALGSTATAVEFSEIARFNLASAPVGAQVTTVAWQNGRLFLGGYNSTGSGQDVSIVEVLDATTAGIVPSPTYGPAFSPVRVQGAQGFSGLSLNADGSKLAAALYGGTTASDSGLQLFTLGSPGAPPQAPPLRKTLIGGSGVAFDPGYFDGVQTTGSGVAWVAFPTLAGANRRMLQDPATFGDLYGTTDGMEWYPEESDGNYRRTRDIDFDPATGDVYTRITNDVGVARRTGGNEVDLNPNSPNSRRLLVDSQFEAATVDNQHLAFLSTPLDGGMIIYNDRPSTSPGQSFADVVKLVSTSGTTSTPNFLTPNFVFLDGYQPAPGAGWYDFDFDDFDEASQTLALLDTSNRQLHIFQVGAAAVVLDSGDFDADGDVDGADFLIWQRNVGMNNGAATLAHGDADGDEHITGDDLAIWRAQFGVTAAPVAQGVPEPSGWILMGGAAVGALSRKRRGRRGRRASRG